ncbi:MAG: Spy/CpxP family protein refolding chaperone [SAR324 cluster bacterium]|nr:Spy/CpxP family protein refolding chaperone [SAR324 cluster bacterium]
MGEKKCRKSKFRKLLFIFLPLGLIAAFGLYGLAHGHGGGWHSPEKLEKTMNWIVEDVAEDLEIRPDQQEAYQALMEQFKAHVRDRISGWRDTGAQLKDQFNKDTLEAGQIAALLKSRIRGRASNEELEALVDRGVEFYQSLSAEQQERFREKAAKHMNRHH